MLIEQGGTIRPLHLKIIRLAVRLIARLNPNLPAMLELDLMHLQGKGSGSVSVEVEAKWAIHFLSMRGYANPVVLDIGANKGAYSDAILKICPAAMFFAFEPSDIARKELQNKFKEGKVTIVPIGLSDSLGTKTLWSDKSGSVLVSFTKRRLDHFGISFDLQDEVQVKTLDVWYEKTFTIPDLIKMDVEGHELAILNGGNLTWPLAQVIQLEFGGCNIDSRTYFQDFWYFFTQSRFVIYRISMTEPNRIFHYSEQDECFITTNYLAVRE